MHVVAAAAAAAHCHVGGAALSAPLECGRSSAAVVETCDALGNACYVGGADVRMVMVLQVATPDPAEEQLAVVDQGDGSYIANVTLSVAGERLLLVLVNGQLVRKDGFRVSALGLGARMPADSGEVRTLIFDFKCPNRPYPHLPGFV